ncbi:GPI ethanolamine phosphate transferase 3 [Anopheles ziemanni]|uniref:GPI ethanolamine phosphate transferase 3 n=1 Tax=Anopheles ziemanni TaxID=345580 RepID=UPI002659A4E2|nr:GPI ethanolamine phosphate transferase 3 isoform X1 [Anopheles coustani]XP_058120308.1 GPI ethanolamine phosphate transferase 3 isoform X1 [Anopheles coustani]XP_058168516.1 GPI ethanolamine phosphate transferase 3 [Anopheles ziemanni]
MMAKSRNFLFVLVWLSLLVSAGIHLFSKGFLLTRVAQTESSSCVKYEDYQCGHTASMGKGGCNGTEKVASILRDVNGSSGICFPPKAKVILLVIDALRYDFGLFDPTNRQPAAYENNLPILQELLRKHPDHSRRLKFIADPPTTTLQRLKGITTGSLPTFIDIGSNFASPEINEDNLIDQLVRHNRTTVFLGDNTWTELFPNRFTREYAYPSFNIYDLDTVDTAIEKYLPREMARDDWDMIVAHFLGVDHCGHRYGPMHEEMRRKLGEMNDVIRNVTEQMADGTTLIVIGDHGMTKTGDHGGETTEEVEALLFMYSKGTPLLARDYDGNSDTMQQIDLVPTLATIMGVPIPYSNLGQIIFQLLPDTLVDSFLRYQLALVHLWQNTRQIERYFQRYAESSAGTFAVDHLDELDNKFLILTQRVNTVYTEAAFQSLSSDLRGYLKDILEGCREIWVKFDPKLILHGLLITFLVCFSIAILFINSTPYQLGQMFNDSVISYALLLTALAIPTGYFFYADLGLSSAEHGAILLSAFANVGLFAFVLVQNWVAIAENMADLKRAANVLTRVSFVYTTCVFFSNSFVVEEPRILSYVLMGFFLAALYTLHGLGGKFAMPRFKLTLFRKSMLVKLVGLTLFAVVLIRLSKNYYRCREEQANCTDYLVKAPTPTPDGQRKRIASSADFLPIVALVVYVVCSRLYLRACGNLTGMGLHVLMARYGPTVAVVCACGHFTIAKTNAQGIPQLHVDALAWVVYGLLIVQLVILAVRPLLVFVLPKRKEVMNVLYNDRNVASEIYKQLKENYNRSGGARTPADVAEIPIVCGLATVYSSVFVATGTILSVVLAMLLGSHGTMGLMIVIAVAVAYGILASIMQYEGSTNLQSFIQPTFRTLLTWIILQQFGFYATAHQPTLSQIDWNAAFVGRTYHFDGSNVLSAVLVLLNTYSTTFLLSVLFPLIVLVPFCVYTMWPSLTQQRTPPQSTKKSPSAGGGSKPATTNGEPTVVRKVGVDGGSVEYRSVTVNQSEETAEAGSEEPGVKATTTKAVDFDVTKGELNLYENEKLFLGTVFKTGCLLLLLQSIRIFCAMFACALHCRHLMVWKIFAPRFIYEGIGSYVMFVGLNLGFLLLLRVHRSVGGLITAINKKR